MIRFAVLPFVMVLVAVPCLSADAPKSDTPDKDLKELQGKWKVDKLVFQGKEVAADAVAKRDLQLTVTGSTMEASEKGKIIERYRIKVNAAADPKAVDRQPIDEKGNVKKENYAGPKGLEQYVDAPVEYGIFEVKDGRLRLCVAGLDQARAKSFDPKVTKNYVLIELVQVK